MNQDFMSDKKVREEGGSEELNVLGHTNTVLALFPPHWPGLLRCDFFHFPI